MSDSCSDSSSEPLAHSEGSEQAFGSSSLLISNQKARESDFPENPHKRRHRRKVHKDDDNECSSSVKLTSSVRQSLRKRRDELEKASTDDDQKLVNYHEIKKEEEENKPSPLFPHSSRRRRSSSLPRNKNKNKPTSIKPIATKSTNKTSEEKKVEYPKQSKCCLLL